jgi:putative hemolysin
MKTIRPLFAALLLAGIFLGACAPAPTPMLAAPPTLTPLSIANPASVFCTGHGGKLEIVTARDGSQTGSCTLPDNTVCEEWAFYRGECGPGAASTPEATPPYPANSNPQAAAQAGRLAVQKLAADLKVDPAAI